MNILFKRTTFDVLIFLVIICTTVTFIPNFIFQGWRYNKYFGGIVLLLLGIYLNRKKLNTLNNNMSAIYFVVIIFIIEIFISFINSNDVYQRAGTYLIYYSLFYVYLVIQDDIKLFYLIKVYVSFSLIIIISSIIVYFTIWIFDVNVFNFIIPESFGYEFRKEVDPSSDTFVKEDYLLAPLFINIISTFHRIEILPFVTMGISYEPHVACYFLFPSLFLLPLFYNKIKLKLFVIFYICFLILSLSTASILSLLIAGFLYFIKTRNKILFIILFLFISIIFITTFDDRFFNYFIQFFDYKLTVSESRLSSINYLYSIFNLNSVIGDGILLIPEIFIIDAKNGIYELIFFSSIYFYFISRSIRLIFSNIPLNTYFGLSFIYLIAHSLKFPFHVINYPFTMFMIFIFIKLPKISK